MDIEDVLKGHGIGGAGSNIKSFQKISTTLNTAQITKDVTITSVDMTKTIIIPYNRLDSNVDTNPDAVAVSAKLTTSTNITLTRGLTRSTGMTCVIYVIEFNNVKSVQRGEFTQTSGYETTITLNSINTSKSIAFASFYTTQTDIVSTRVMLVIPEIINGTTLVIRNSIYAVNPKYVSWQVIEFN